MKPPICPWRGLLSDTVGGTPAKMSQRAVEWRLEESSGHSGRRAIRFFHLLSYPCTGARRAFAENIWLREQNESGATKKCRQERHSAGGRPQFHHFQAHSRATESRRYDAHCIISDRSWHRSGHDDRNIDAVDRVCCMVSRRSKPSVSLRPTSSCAASAHACACWGECSLPRRQRRPAPSGKTPGSPATIRPFARSCRR